MSLVIEPAKESDAAAILAIMATANMHYVPSEEMPDLDWRCFFIALYDGMLVGAAGYRITSPDSAKTTLMAVLPQYRKFGIGRALQLRRMQALREQGVKTLITNADLPETIAWYKKHFGYRETGKLKKVHEFGSKLIDEWTTLQTELS